MASVICDGAIRRAMQIPDMRSADDGDVVIVGVKLSRLWPARRSSLLVCETQEIGK